jgi:nitroreductase
LIIDLLSRRASVRSFKPDPVPEDVLQRILEAGPWG